MRFNRTLWTLQGLLAALFLFAGTVKLVLPIDQMTGPVELPGLFLRFIGVVEILGGVGLVLPGLLRIHPELMPVASAGLVIIMAGATVITAMGGAIAPALFPGLVGVCLVSIGYARWRVSPIVPASRLAARWQRPCGVQPRATFPAA